MSCTFCQIISREIPTEFVSEDDQVVVFPDIKPLADVHLLIVPTAHIRSLAETTPDQQALLGRLLRVAVEVAAKQQLRGYRIGINTGREAGQTVDHLHLHLLSGAMRPREAGDPRPPVLE